MVRTFVLTRLLLLAVCFAVGRSHQVLVEPDDAESSAPQLLKSVIVDEGNVPAPLHHGAPSPASQPTQEDEDPASLPRQSVRELFPNHHDTDEVKALLKYRSKRSRQRIAAMAPLQSDYDFTDMGVVAVKARLSQLKRLEQVDSSIEVEVDVPVELAADVPYGIAMVGGNLKLPPGKAYQGNCQHPRAFRIGIIDSGVFAGHPNLPCSGPDDQGCLGRSFGTEDVWYLDRNGHGTHVTGIIGALEGDSGIRGMIADRQVCYLIGRVFSDDSGRAFTSDILAALQWLIGSGANVVNISSVTSVFSSLTATEFYNAFQRRGLIVVAAAGNDGSSGLSYPASYPHVLSVAGVDRDRQRANFSQHNAAIDLAAPAVSILSTAPIGEKKGFFTLSVEQLGVHWRPTLMTNSPVVPDDAVAGFIVDCGQATEVCPGSGGHVCLIERGGSSTFQAKRCQSSGARAALFYYTENDDTRGYLLVNFGVEIPIFELSREQGLQLVQHSLGQDARITYTDGYSYLSGTSFAAPHVTGAIAAVWRVCHQCNHRQVVRCLLSSASDLGAAGRDDEYGRGLVSTKRTYRCLRRKIRCCRRRS